MIGRLLCRLGFHIVVRHPDFNVAFCGRKGCDW